MIGKGNKRAFLHSFANLGFFWHFLFHFKFHGLCGGGRVGGGGGLYLLKDLSLFFLFFGGGVFFGLFWSSLAFFWYF